MLIFSGATVSSRDGSKKITAQKQGDAWTIGVNDFDFYTIPDAVVSGG